MPDLNLSKFIEMSSLVGNKNILIKNDEIQNIIEKEDFDFIHLNSSNNYKECHIDEKGIEKSLIEASAAIAETGTIILKSKSEKIRLASSLAEELNILLYEKDIINSLEEAEFILSKEMAEDTNFIAFITGASRTADIERVLTIGVHGPVRMNIYIVQEER